MLLPYRSRIRRRMGRMRNKLLVIFVMLMGLAFFFPIWFPFLTRWDATMYAPGYDEKEFRQIARGMTKAEVANRLGLPLSNSEGHVEGLPANDNRWFYAWYDCARIPHDDRVCNAWFSVREVTFDKDGRVEAVHRSTEQFE